MKQTNDKEKTTCKGCHIKKVERLEIGILLKKGYSIRAIAGTLKRSPSTISDEIKKNSVDNEYNPHKANHKAYVRRKYSKYQGMKINQNDELKKYIIEGLKNHLNPDEVSGRMRLESKPYYVSKNSIYRWLYSVYGQRYCYHLSSMRFRPRKRKPKAKRTLIPNRIGIEARSDNVDYEYNHYEADTIVSRKSKKSLIVLYERKTKYVKIKKINNLKPNSFNNSLLEIKNGIKKIKSLTLDNGIENRYWERLGIKNVYFCDPYSSWQKGGVENINGMIRKYIIKGSDISNYSNNFIQMVENILNNKPRKSLGYKTPYEVMVENNLLIKKTPDGVRFEG